MILISNFFNQNTKVLILNILFCTFPITFILGNLALNLNILCLILGAIFFYSDKLNKIQFNNFDKLLILFFIYLILIGILNFIEINYIYPREIKHFYNPDIFILNKTFVYLRFLFLYFSIKFLIKDKIIKVEYFFLISSICCLFISFDILIQYFFGKNIFGIPPYDSRKLSSVFGQELIAGGFIQKFFPFLFLYLLIVKKKNFFLINTIVIFILVSTFLTGNRVPFIMTIVVLMLFLFFLDKLKKNIFVILLIFFLFFTALFLTNNNIKNNYISFYNQSLKILLSFTMKEIDRDKMPPHFSEFESFYDTWQLNKYFGGGVRSFRIFCPIRKNIDIKNNERTTCNTHPHNYYLEILAEIGLFGFFLIIIVFLKTIMDSYKKYFMNKNTFSTDNYFLLPFLILFIVEVFPIKSSGSFFSTWNSTFVFIIISSLRGLIEKNKVN